MNIQPLVLYIQADIPSHFLRIFPMVHCSGCSASFPNLTGNQCGRCKSLTPKPKENWGLCTLCGDLYEFLDKATCFKCQADQGLPVTLPFSFISLKDFILISEKTDNSLADAAAVRHAMSNSVNPRTHSNYGSPVYANPYINKTVSLTPDNNDEVLSYFTLKILSFD